MSIVKKTILMIVGITAVLFLLVFLISNFIYLKGFETLENQQVESSVSRIAGVINNKLNTLDNFCQDWANWDDTYNFATGHNPEYAARNLMDETFATQEISLILVLNTSGEMIYGKAYDIINAQDTGLPGDLPVFLTSSFVKNAVDAQKEFTGVTVLSGQPLMAAFRPIYTSLNEGPIAGYLLVGRFIDDSFIKSLSIATQFPVTILPMQNPGQNPEMDTALNSLEVPGLTFIKTENNKTIDGYGEFKDLNGNPAFIYKVSIPRDIFAQGQRAVIYLHASLFVIAIAFCVIFVFFFRRLILTRLTTLANAVNTIGSRGEISNRVQIKGNDELSRLADNINGMLESLEKSETRRQSQKEVIGNIVTITPNGIVAVNDNGHITLLNDAFRAMFDLKNRNMMGVKLEDLPDMSDIAIEINNFRLSRMTSFKKEIHRVRNGVNKIYIANFARLKEEELYILYLMDISEERAKQESLYLTDRLASVGEMASGIAHELNNPLTSIIGLSEIVMRDDVPESVKEDVGLIKSESHRAAGIVRNLLSFARKNAAVKQVANINKIINDVLRLRSYEHGVNNIKVVKELDNNLPDIMVDYSQIQQVFINIILNAEFAMVNAHGKGILKIKAETAGSMLRITFTDDGPGIEPGNLRHIFDPFFTTKEAGKGTGLGLSISYGIVTAHNGRIYATSEFGKGAAFVVELPLNSPAAKETKPNA
jgi:signal transduction histidine kinase